MERSVNLASEKDYFPEFDFGDSSNYGSATTGGAIEGSTSNAID
jgi:hypothetical protein